MSRLMLLLALALAGLSAAPAPNDAPAPAGIFVFDDCDEQYKDKAEYQDNLTFLDLTGKQAFRLSGFNNCQSIGSSRMVATDARRGCVWVLENVGQRLRRFDLAGKETLDIHGVHGSAIAVDPATGNVWALEGEGRIGHGKTAVYGPTGKQVRTFDLTGWDIAYDRKGKAFWIAERGLTKVSAATGELQFSVEITDWCASSVDVDQRTGAAWVGVRDQAVGKYRLLKFDADGKELLAIDLVKKCPFRVSVDQKDGSVWVAQFRKSVDRFASDGKLLASHPVAAFTVQADPSGGHVWAVTATEIQKISAQGGVSVRVPLAGKTSHAWIAAME